MTWQMISHFRILEKLDVGRTRGQIIVLIGLSLLCGCLDESHKTYIVTDAFRIVAGPQTGLSGSSQSELNVSLVGVQCAEYVSRSFANSYSVKLSFSNIIQTIAKQDFPYHRGRVSINGKGYIFGDTLTYHYFSGGPAGLINPRCMGVLKKAALQFPDKESIRRVVCKVGVCNASRILTKFNSVFFK